jgi:hypothetical protein
LHSSTLHKNSPVRLRKPLTIAIGVPSCGAVVQTLLNVTKCIF